MNSVLVLGAGNPLMGDDGFGLAVLEALRQDFAFPATVRLEDGGTWGMNLLPLVEDASALLLLDAIDVGAAPGVLVRLERELLPRYLSLKLSPHQIGLQEIFALCTLRGTMPACAVALGVQPARVALGLELSPPAAAALAPTAERAIAQLEDWGVGARRREACCHA